MTHDTDKGSERPRPPTLRLRFWAGAAAVGVAAIAVAAALVGPRLSLREVGCPAIGYSSLLHVSLTGNTDGVAQVQVRDGEQWQPPVPTGPDATAPAVPTARDGDTWSFTLFYPPNPMALRALDDDGAVLSRWEVDVEWERVGGTQTCGGPMEGRVEWAL